MKDEKWSLRFRKYRLKVFLADEGFERLVAKSWWYPRAPQWMFFPGSPGYYDVSIQRKMRSFAKPHCNPNDRTQASSKCWDWWRKGAITQKTSWTFSEQMKCLRDHFRTYMNAHEGCMFPSSWSFANLNSSEFRPCNESTLKDDYFNRYIGDMFNGEGPENDPCLCKKLFAFCNGP